MTPERMKIRETVAETGDSFAEDVRCGLSSATKFLLPKYFYDELGSILFDAITLLPEYYPTRAEAEILRSFADEIVSRFNGEIRLLEFGSGSATKTRWIIEAILRRQKNLVFTPIDISPSALESSAKQLLETYPNLQIEAFAGDYFAFLQTHQPNLSKQTLALFLGSNIGNFAPSEATEFLSGVRQILREGDALLIGADLKKSRKTLEAAYDDALGVTSAFNLNILRHINREFDGDFEVSQFKHLAFYNEEKGRVEIYIESLREQTVNLRTLNLRIEFTEGERIHTENSHKYDAQDLAKMAAESDFRVEKTWFDAEKRFSSNFFRA